MGASLTTASDIRQGGGCWQYTEYGAFTMTCEGRKIYNIQAESYTASVDLIVDRHGGRQLQQSRRTECRYRGYEYAGELIETSEHE
jgi:uncharacterized protein YraI